MQIVLNIFKKAHSDFRMVKEMGVVVGRVGWPSGSITSTKSMIKWYQRLFRITEGVDNRVTQTTIVTRNRCVNRLKCKSFLYWKLFWDTSLSSHFFSGFRNNVFSGFLSMENPSYFRNLLFQMKRFENTSCYDVNLKLGRL